MKRSFIENSPRGSSNKKITPSEIHLDQFHLYRHSFEEVTLETNDKEVPFIALFKPNFNLQKKRLQGAAKLGQIFAGNQRIKMAYAVSRMIALLPKQKLIQTKTRFLIQQFDKIVQKRKENVWRSITVNKIKRNGCSMAAKLVWKVQNSVLNRNIKNCFALLVRNKLLAMVKELSNQNQLAQELKIQRNQVFRLKEEAFSEQFIVSSKEIQKQGNYESYLENIQEIKFSETIKRQIKRFESLRNNSSPRRKELLNNEIVALNMNNLISSFQKSTKEYERHCSSLQAELAGFKDTQGINQLREVLREKEGQLREIQTFVGELSRMDTELKKFTLQNRFQVDKINSTINIQVKKLETKSKNLEGTSSKLFVSRNFASSVISGLIKKIDNIQSEYREGESERKQLERNQKNQLTQYKRDLDAVRNELNQERTKLSALLQKKEVKRGLQDLKRRWKGNEELKSLVDYIINLQQKIEDLQKEQKIHITHDQQMVEGIINITNHVNSGVQQIKNTQQIPNSFSTLRLRNSQLSDLMSSVERAFNFLFQSSRGQRQELQQSAVQITYQSQPESAGKFTRSPQKKMPQKKIEQQQAKKNNEKNIHVKFQQPQSFVRSQYFQSSESMVNQLRDTILSFQKHLHANKLHETEQYQSILNALNRIQDLVRLLSHSETIINQLQARNADFSLKLEQQRNDSQSQLQKQEKQLGENNKLIREFLQKNNNQTRQVPDKNENNLVKQIELQEQIIRLKSTIEENMRVHKNEFLKERQENKFLLNKIRQMQNQTLHKKQAEMLNQKDLSAQLLGQLKQKMISQERKLQTLKYSSSKDQDKSMGSALSRIQELMELLRQSEVNVTQLTMRNTQLLNNFQHKRTEYQNQIRSLEQKNRLLQNQLNLKNQLVKKQAQHVPVSSDRNEELVNKNFQLQEEVIRLKCQLDSLSQQRESNYQKETFHKEQNIKMIERNNEMQIDITRKTSQIDRLDYLLKQNEGWLRSQKQKIKYLQTQLGHLSEQLNKSYLENERLALETRDQGKKITGMLKMLELQLDKKTKQFQELSRKYNQQQSFISRLKNQNTSYLQQLKQALTQCNNLQQKNASLYGELAHIKADFYSMQTQLSTNRTSKVHNNNNDQLLSLQSQIKDKQETISNILERSKADAKSLNQQLFEAKQELIIQQKRYEEQLGVKNSLINRYEHRIIQLQSSIRSVQQKCMVLEQNIQRSQHNKSKVEIETPQSNDRQIQFLHQQISSLQSFLADLSHQYKELETKYHQEKQRFGRFNDYAKQQHSIEEIDKAIHALGDNSQLGQEVKALIVNNQQLQMSIQDLEDQRKKLLEKARSLPERQYVVQLLFNVLLGARKLSAQSQIGNSIWNELIQINQRCQDVGELFTELQRFSLRLVSLSG